MTADATPPAVTGMVVGTRRQAEGSPTPPPALGQPYKSKDHKKRVKTERKRFQNAQRAAAKKEGKFGADPLLIEIRELVGSERVDARMAASTQFEQRYALGTEMEVQIDLLTSVGVGLGRDPGAEDWVIAVPKSLPGDRARVKVVKNDLMRSKAVVIELLERSEWRTETPGCKYFDQCGGCQYQMVAYPRQLKIKRSVVQKAFRFYSELDPSRIPDVLSTLPSPQQMGYRTKLTPHFNLPSGARQWRKQEMAKTNELGLNFDPSQSHVPKPDLGQWPIGFDSDQGRMLDIEECPIATPAINEALPVERQKVRDNIWSYPNGSTMLYRDSIVPAEEGDQSVVVTDMKNGTMNERVGPLLFEGPAGDFFQNNRSILVPVVELIQSEIARFRSGLSDELKSQPSYLVDTYCGAGLFALSLASEYQRVAGVEISSRAIECAKRNAQTNGIENVTFLAASAEHIFAQVQDFVPDTTTVVIDPPRKGCDEVFLDQLLALRPKLAIYVSCNVHTQARDVGYVLNKDPSYSIFSLRAMDFFPQTFHVEGLCILQRT